MEEKGVKQLGTIGIGKEEQLSVSSLESKSEPGMRNHQQQHSRPVVTQVDIFLQLFSFLSPFFLFLSLSLSTFPLPLSLYFSSLFIFLSLSNSSVRLLLPVASIEFGPIVNDFMTVVQLFYCSFPNFYP